MNDHLYFTFSDEAQNEIQNYIKSLSIQKYSFAASLDLDTCPIFIEEMEVIRNELENGNRIVIVRPLVNFEKTYSIPELRILYWFMSCALGDQVVQNEAGEKSVLVYDRNRINSVSNGARYHQTREGGMFHTDNVNTPFKWDYILLACLSPSIIGGESVLVNGLDAHRILKEHFPDALSTLEENFLWEQRGIVDNIFEAPIISYNPKGEAEFRYLRPYMESAHKKMNKPLTDQQIYALNTLEAIFEHSKNQYRHTFSKGEILLTYDAYVPHSRTSFSDSLDAVALDEWYQDREKPLKRTMDRIWIQKRAIS
jgi:hypothetical protein